MGKKSWGHKKGVQSERGGEKKNQRKEIFVIKLTWNEKGGKKTKSHKGSQKWGGKKKQNHMKGMQNEKRKEKCSNGSLAPMF